MGACAGGHPRIVAIGVARAERSRSLPPAGLHYRRKRLAKERARPGKPRYGPPAAWAILIVRALFLASAVLWTATAWFVAQTTAGRVLAVVVALSSLVASCLDASTLRGAVRAVAKQQMHIPD